MKTLFTLSLILMVLDKLGVLLDVQFVIELMALLAELFKSHIHVCMCNKYITLINV